MLGRSILNFRLFGIDVHIHWSWLLIFIFFSWSLSSYFKGMISATFLDIYPNPDIVSWTLSVSLAVLIFVSVLIHEFGHSLVARRFGLEIKGITLFILGGVANIDLFRDTKDAPFRDLCITVIGPVVSFVLAIIFWVASYIVGGSDSTKLSVFLFLLLSQLAVMNLILAIFNALPIYPMDGGRVLLALLQIFGKDQWHAHRLATTGGIIGSGLIIFVGIFWGAFFLVFIGIFLLLINIQERRKVQ